ncbi:MAG: hypothetical protein AAF668_15180 [Pseudomonadota bacterium]
MSDAKAPSTFELYELYLSTIEKISDRRSSANQWLLSVNSAIVGLYGYISASRAVGGEDMLEIWRWAIPIAGLATAFTWMSLLSSYRKLNRAKFTVLRTLEEELPNQLFKDEEAAYMADRRRDLSAFETAVPWIFALLYLAFIASNIVNRYAG